ncbi:MAG: hypothetical protein Q4E39_05355 [bacterium]|nr:hypothetical protein [bacterium]
MPGPKTHNIFYKDLKKQLNTNTLDSFPNYDDYSIFAQGHDFLIYHNFYKIWNNKQLNKNIADSSTLQEGKISEFVYNYMNIAINNGSIEKEDVRLFLGPGYLMHHVLDAYTHPLIIFYSGDHTRDLNNKTWEHGIVENLLDIYLMEHLENKNPREYPVYKDFIFSHMVSPDLINTLNLALEETYGIKDGGQRFAESIYQVEMFIKKFKYDPTGLKRVFFDLVDPILKGTKSFSYNRDCDNNLDFLNLNHEEWLNPNDNKITSTMSFLDLYKKALNDGANIIDELEKIAKHGVISYLDICDLVPNVSSITGLESGKKLELKYTKKR